MLEDNKFGKIFPTRTGKATGTANERQMLDAIGGSNSFRTRMTNNVDGSVTMLRTRNGMPEFKLIHKLIHKEQEEVYSYYMESGQLSWTFPNTYNEQRFHPAKWTFADIEPTDEYLGYIKGSYPGEGAQRNKTLLVDGMDSLAVGYPRSQDQAKDDETRLGYGSSTVNKKLAMGYYPSSLFSGKMRLFVQALYGAIEKRESENLYLNVSGSSVALMYKIFIKDKSYEIQLGMSVGVFGPDDGKWWLINIISGEHYTVKAYPIRQTAAGRKLLSAYRKDPSEKLEAYVLAHSWIDLSNPQDVGVFDGAKGSPLAYGWKWNSRGDRASMIVHKVLGTGNSDNRWSASTMHLSFSQADGVVQMATETVPHGEWIDGRGEFNIFVPVAEELSAPLRCKSLKFELGTFMVGLKYSDIPVYGYYINDVWTTVFMSSTEDETEPTYEYVKSNVTLDPAYPSDHIGFDGWYMNGSVSCELGIKTITNRTNMMSISFSGFSERGWQGRVSFEGNKGEAGGNIDIDPSVRRTGFNGSPTITTWNWPLSWGGQLQESVSHCLGWDAMMAWKYPDSLNPSVDGRVTWAPLVHRYTDTLTYYVGSDYRAWALVIPSLDAEAVIIPKWDYSSATSGTERTRSSDNISYGSTAIGFVCAWTKQEIDADPQNKSSYDGWWIIESGLFASPWRTPAHRNVGGEWKDVVSVDIAGKVMRDEYSVTCFNSKGAIPGGIPGGSYYAIFHCERTYPYYDRGMWIRTSHGKRFVGSEISATPPSVINASFVGWA